MLMKYTPSFLKAYSLSENLIFVGVLTILGIVIALAVFAP